METSSTTNLTEKASRSKNSAEGENSQVQSISNLDLNSYATRKSFAQGMLDLALLTANASQLKYLLTVGEVHEFYHLLMTLVILSISLQVFQAVMIIILAVVLDINKVEQHKKSDILNNVLIIFTVISVVINVIISAFDMRTQGDLIPTTTPPGGMTTTADAM
ncbi:ninjurin-2-like isoform X2 [Uranotaenia lowii]|uniref:ninjurin-2-like isoform X2 n=1 Tax=Uranotaenia lowii TaxID=190385 RepID=UPI00247A2B90|nr:ninjurin-2-like isoform X2 [Uranotaenia lowii]